MELLFIVFMFFVQPFIYYMACTSLHRVIADITTDHSTAELEATVVAVLRVTKLVLVMGNLVVR